ncbi:hypothetical protein [Octadecabacter arcticus]|jgi:hypothetical protein|uniref:hypothetical protein n=1 Tax=Octadecabacter arcticus TaxID=53946 RepID=UPI0005C5ED12|nr:hypothetical protein [Octadecabacter arcticus]
MIKIIAKSIIALAATAILASCDGRELGNQSAYLVLEDAQGERREFQLMENVSLKTCAMVIEYEVTETAQHGYSFWVNSDGYGVGKDGADVIRYAIVGTVCRSS